jgi:hypothetical protein
VSTRIEDSLRAAAGATLAGERPQIFGGSAPARPSPFSTPPARSRGPVGDRAPDEVGPRQAPGRRSGSRRGLRDEAAQDRRHQLLYRLLPAAAAVVLLVGGTAVVVDVLGGRDSATEASDDAAEEVIEASAEAGAAGPVPNGLVATGTEYTEGDLGAAALELVAAVGTGAARTTTPAQNEEAAGDAADGAGEDQSAAAGEAPAAASGAPDPVTTSPLASADAFRACAQALGAPEGVLPVAVDLATFEGTEAAVVVLPNRAGDGYEVIVTDRSCNPSSQRAAAGVLAP